MKIEKEPYPTTSFNCLISGRFEIVKDGEIVETFNTYRAAFIYMRENDYDEVREIGKDKL